MATTSATSSSAAMEAPTIVVSFIIAFALLVQPFFVFLLFTQFYFAPLLYYVWVFYDRNAPYAGGRRIEWVRRLFIWKYFVQYFPAQLVKTAELDPDTNYVIGYHPHGRYVSGAATNFATDGTRISKIFPGITPHIIGFGYFFWAPAFREILLSFGFCASSKESINYVLSKKGKGNAAVIVVGGAKEILSAQPYTMKLKLKDRKGFVRMAVKNGAHLVPTITFGENELYPPLIGQSLANYLETHLRYIVYAWALVKFLLLRMPKRLPITTVVGKPIEVVRDENASEEVIDKYHQQYIQSLQQLFDEYKTKVGDGYKDMELTLY